MQSSETSTVSTLIAAPQGRKSTGRATSGHGPATEAEPFAAQLERSQAWAEPVAKAQTAATVIKNEPDAASASGADGPGLPAPTSEPRAEHNGEAADHTQALNEFLAQLMPALQAPRPACDATPAEAANLKTACESGQATDANSPMKPQQAARPAGEDLAPSALADPGPGARVGSTPTRAPEPTRAATAPARVGPGLPPGEHAAAGSQRRHGIAADAQRQGEPSAQADETSRAASFEPGNPWKDGAAAGEPLRAELVGPQDSAPSGTRPDMAQLPSFVAMAPTPPLRLESRAVGASSFPAQARTGPRIDAAPDGANSFSGAVSAQLAQALDGPESVQQAQASGPKTARQSGHAERSRPDSDSTAAATGLALGNPGPQNPDAELRQDAADQQAVAMPSPMAAVASLPAPGSAPVQPREPTVSLALPIPVQAPQFHEALGVQVSVLARDGVQHAELHLNPAEMGPLSVQIVLDGQQSQVQVHFGTDSLLTRHIVEAGLPALASALRDAGLTLSGGGVSQHPQGQRQSARPGRAPAGPELGVGEIDASSVRTLRVASGRLDTFA